MAKMFLEAGFPPGVVNYIQHNTEDASECFEAIITHKDVRKCNFTGSTNVGKHIAKTAASHLKPVLLELGGKNFAIVLDDANLEKAADQVLLGGFLNIRGSLRKTQISSDSFCPQSGQICMSTDLVLVAKSIEKDFRRMLHQRLFSHLEYVTTVINARSGSRIEALLSGAEAAGRN
jgi:acyl-CoA reductase-like NAD-dependent aldehyde dehydrogenase